MRETLCHLFDRTEQVDPDRVKSIDKSPRVLLEMAYKPVVTPLMQLASDSGWDTIPGLEVLVGQGVYQVSSRLSGNADDAQEQRGLIRVQFKHWNGIFPPYNIARVCITLFYSVTPSEYTN